MPKRKAKVFVAMSGGVDSSVAAALLKQQGYAVIGVYMRCYNLDGCADQDAEDARRVAEILGIPFYIFDFEEDYKKRVVDYMIDGYRHGLTPNPDVMCNKEIKFGLFLKKALELGADYVATGHYVRVCQSANNEFRANKRITNSQFVNSKSIRYSLMIAKDKKKDQSYFLWTLTPDQLKHCLFPIGDYLKPQVRKLAAKFGLLNAQKKDSQGICFLGQISLPDFLKKYIKPKKGRIVSVKGEILGEHNGAHFYTIGQRRGLGIGGFKKPLYVADKNIKKNIVVVAEGEDHPALYRKQINLEKVNLLNHEVETSVLARVRYRQPLEKANLIIHDSKFMLHFKKPVKFVAVGQSAVFYNQRGEMLGGGVIKSAK